MDVELPTEYDVIVVGTGLIECIVAAASARIGKKVLHIDQNDYYGGKWSSFTLQGIDQWTGSVEKGAVKDNKAEKCELDDGEKAVPTCDPNRGYSKIKQEWHVPKNEEVPSSAEPVEPAAEAAAEKAEEAKPAEEPSETEGGSKPETGAETQKERKKWSQEAMMKLTRKFNLDLTPKLLYSRGALVELLISSNVARYAEFKCITRILTWHGSSSDEESLVMVPCSRSDVFTASSISLVEKRLLMKVLESCQSYDQHPEQFEEYNDKPFIDFLKSRQLTDNLIHYVTESIAMVPKDSTCREGLEKMKLFLSSLGRYGTTPFLFSMYGCGELPQAFCRLCAVFEGTYVLRRGVSSIVFNAEGKCAGLISEGQRFRCSNLVMDVDYAPQNYAPAKNVSTKQCISRAIFVTDRSIMPNDKEQLTFLRFPAKNGNTKPINVLEIGSGSGVCPKDLYCIHMTCLGYDAEEDFKSSVEKLFATDEDSDKPKILWSLYFNQEDFSGVDLSSCGTSNLHLCSGPDSQLDYDSAISQAQSVFSQMFPEEEFLPRAPDPEEIVFDNAGAEPKEGDNFESKPEEAEDTKGEGEAAEKPSEE
ncbi:rab proteins geranylgeranyltransferase component A 1 [Penaeus vannamei]|uniref:rab proteins geranylgeranyltransferase component A 1 n=1 Tax=Penaeus vannamei TaxID=6689 RepID=UPI00387F4F35